jgi:hypothetical protein
MREPIVGGDNHFIVRGLLPDGEIALALIRHCFLIQIGATIPAPLGRWEIITREFRGIAPDKPLCRNLNQDVGDVAKFTEDYDVGIDANTAHGSSSRWKCVRPRSVHHAMGLR